VVVEVGVAGLKRGLACALMLVLSACALSVLIVSCSSASIPYWVRPGAYAVYESYRPLAMNIFYGMWVDSNGTTHEYYCQLNVLVRLKWVVLKVKGDLAFVNVTLTLIDPKHGEVKCGIIHYLFRKGEGGAFASFYPDPQVMGKFVGVGGLRKDKLAGPTVLGFGEVSWSRLVWVNLLNSSIIVDGSPYPESFLFFINPCLISENRSIYFVKTLLDAGDVIKYLVYVFGNFTSILNERDHLDDGNLLNTALPIFKDMRKLVPSSPLSKLGLGRVYTTYCYNYGENVEKNLSLKPHIVLDFTCGWVGNEPPSFYDSSSGIMLALVLYDVEYLHPATLVKTACNEKGGSWGILYRLFNITDVFIDESWADSINVSKYRINYNFIYLVDTNVPLGRPVFGGVVGVVFSEWLGLLLGVVVACVAALVVVWGCERG